jgi:hypothetical protein
LGETDWLEDSDTKDTKGTKVAKITKARCARAELSAAPGMS